MLSRQITRREQVILVFVAASITLGTITLLFLQHDRSEPEALLIESVEPVVLGEAAPGTSPESGETPVAEVVVSVQGAVRNPGVYTLDVGSRVNDLVTRAGGVRTNADTATVNLAARLIDGTTLLIPDHDATKTTGATHAAYTVTGQPPTAYTSATLVSGAKPSSMNGGNIDINAASSFQLESLPGIGPKLAQQIVQYRSERKFRSIEELMDVSGIGPKRFESIRAYVVVY